MPETFTWNPSRNFIKNTKPSVIAAEVGILSARKTLGINTLNVEWELSFANKSVQEVNSIMAFLDRHYGSKYFLFTPPGESTIYKVISQEYNVIYESYYSRSISVKFVKVNDIG